MKKLILVALLASSACMAPQVVSQRDGAPLHSRLLTLDTHLDTPAFFDRPDWDFGARHVFADDIAQVDLGRMDSGALDGGFFVIYTGQGPLTAAGYAEARNFALKRADAIRATFAKYPDRIGLALTAADADRLDRAGKRIGYISIENSYPLGEDLSLLAEFHRRGVRMASPVHFRNNQFADAATDQPRWNGLSPLGREWVKEMNRLGMVVDASHASDAVLDQLIELSRTPVILSHSSAKATFDHPRNLDDARIRKLAASGGAICMNSAYLAARQSSPERSAIADRLEKETNLPAAERLALIRQLRALEVSQPVQAADFETYMAGLLHLIRVAGVDGVCFGADWDGGGGVKGFEDIEAQPRITERLRAAGYSETDVGKMWSGNVLRLLRAAERAKG